MLQILICRNTIFSKPHKTLKWFLWWNFFKFGIQIPFIQQFFIKSFFSLYFNRCGRKPQKFIAPVRLHRIFFKIAKIFPFYYNLNLSKKNQMLQILFCRNTIFSKPYKTLTLSFSLTALWNFFKFGTQIPFIQKYFTKSFFSYIFINAAVNRKSL